MAEITIYTVPTPSEADWYGWPWEYVGPTPPTPDPTINLLSAVPDGPLALVLTFDRAPGGDALEAAAYALSALDGGYLPEVLSAAYAPDPSHDFSHKVRLTLGQQCTEGDTYRVTVSGIVGPCDEALGTATADWEAIGTGPAVLSAASSGLLGIRVVFDEAVQECEAAGTWLIEDALGAPVAVASVAGTDAVRQLGLGAALVPGQPYSLTAPATTKNVPGNLIATADRDAAFTVPVLTGKVSIRATGGGARCSMLLVMPANVESGRV
jgi:hypothetical protein